jgi:hypothetical protein
MNLFDVSPHRVTRKTFGSSMDEGAGEWRRLHNEDFYDQYNNNINTSND